MKNSPLEFYLLVASGQNGGLCWEVNLLHIAMIKLGAANISDSISEAEAFLEN